MKRPALHNIRAARRAQRRRLAVIFGAGSLSLVAAWAAEAAWTVWNAGLIAGGF